MFDFNSACKKLAELTSQEDLLAASLKELSDKKKEVLAEKESLENSIKENLHEDSFVTDEYEITFSSSRAVEIVDEKIIPNEYKKIKFEIDKKSIRSLLM